jgi:hypothetical protein
MHPLLIEGLSDAVGFVGGTLVGAGGGGLHLAQRWRSAHRAKGDE